MTLDKFVATRRKQLSMSLDAVGEAAGLSKPTVHDIERGNTKDPKTSTVIGLAKALKVKPDLIFACAVESLKEQN